MTAMTSAASPARTSHATDDRPHTDPALLPDLDEGPRCECPHTGSDTPHTAVDAGRDAPVSCGRAAAWRVTTECVCGGGHPRRMELLCTRCLNNRSSQLGRERVTVRGI
ncbi:hypothetical protein [Microbacterium sufflavum]|uniref:Uncharacterized protein n=1 Tax=Microbacterium sufflavum TaxID=2851649 RepID=A0ABY4IGA2_9MICO|nr:hypothetical protein [Microbacterium sufflavum]UPL10886.1 hypothetical protein KV394_07105 [Microbacterium sufflavum]